MQTSTVALAVKQVASDQVVVVVVVVRLRPCESGPHLLLLPVAPPVAPDRLTAPAATKMVATPLIKFQTKLSAAMVNTPAAALTAAVQVVAVVVAGEAARVSSARTVAAR
jgi:hypothetical protein